MTSVAQELGASAELWRDRSRGSPTESLASVAGSGGGVVESFGRAFDREPVETTMARHPGGTARSRRTVIEDSASAVTDCSLMTDRIDVRTPDRERLPPGQIVTQKWPVLHYGTVPMVDTAHLALRGQRRGGEAFTLTWDELLAAAPAGDAVRHPLRHPLEPLRQPLRGCPGGAAASSGRGPEAGAPSCWCMPSMASPPTFRWTIWSGRPTCWPSSTTART